MTCITKGVPRKLLAPDCTPTGLAFLQPFRVSDVAMRTGWMQRISVDVDAYDVPHNGLGKGKVAIAVAGTGTPVQVADDGAFPLAQHLVWLCLRNCVYLLFDA